MIPSNRPIVWELIEHLTDQVQVLIVDDSADGLPSGPRRNVVMIGEDAQRDMMGPLVDCIPRKSSAVRNFGHYYAWREGFKVAFAVDSDCGLRPGWLDQHLARLGPVTEAPALSAPWIDTIGIPRVFARGFPYTERDPERPAPRSTTRSGVVKAHMGLWDGVLDVNGIDKLEAPPPLEPVLPPGGAAIADGFFPMCGMNLAFTTDIVPALYFMPDFWVDGWRVSRHDDIWGGYILECLLEINGDLASFGAPVIEHTLQSPLEKVVVLEHYQHLLAPAFYDTVDAAAADLAPAPYSELYAAFAEAFRRLAPQARVPGHWRRGFIDLGDAMCRWAACYV